MPQLAEYIHKNKNKNKNMAAVLGAVRPSLSPSMKWQPSHLFFLELHSNVVVLLFYVHGKHLRSCRDGQLT